MTQTGSPSTGESPGSGSKGELALELWDLLRRTPPDVEVSPEWAARELRCSREDLREAARLVEEVMISVRKEAAKREEPPEWSLPPASKEMRDLFAFA